MQQWLPYFITILNHDVLSQKVQAKTRFNTATRSFHYFSSNIQIKRQLNSTFVLVWSYDATIACYKSKRCNVIKPFQSYTAFCVYTVR